MKPLLHEALRLLDKPYIWGGDNPLRGFDCSGFVQWVLATVGMDPKGDQSAQALYDHCLLQGMSQVRGAGALVFYGKSPERITHVALMINEFQIIEAGGGGSECTTREIAAQKGACVRIKMFGHRSDMLGFFMPDYPEWVKNG